MRKKMPEQGLNFSVSTKHQKKAFNFTLTNRVLQSSSHRNHPPPLFIKLASFSNPKHTYCAKESNCCYWKIPTTMRKKKVVFRVILAMFGSKNNNTFLL
jgi:hypothetical protein